MCALLIGAGVGLTSGVAHADVSSWLGINVGAGQIHQFALDRQLVPTLRLSTGMGTDPSHPWIVGGLLQLDTWFGHGTDLSFLMRLADHGYTNGDWGVAFDLGPVARFWGPGSYGAQAVANIGGPWGLMAGLHTNVGSEDVRSLGCFVGIDLARLTVLRRSGSSWWKNSFPAYRTREEQEH